MATGRKTIRGDQPQHPTEQTYRRNGGKHVGCEQCLGLCSSRNFGLYLRLKRGGEDGKDKCDASYSAQSRDPKAC